MVIFIFGDDIYQSETRLKELKSKFEEKYDEINISIFSIEKKEKIDLSKILNEIDSVPFLGTKRLIIIKELLKNGDSGVKEKILKKLIHIPESSIVIFFEKGIPRKNERLFKNLLKLAKVEEFSQEKGLSLTNWIKKEVIERGGKIEYPAIEKLVSLVGDDSLRLSNEIDKLINFSFPKTISKEDIERIVSEKIQTKIFDLVDDLARREGERAIKSMHRLRSLGEKDIYLLSMMVFGFRNIILVKYLNGKNQALNQAQLSKMLNLHPYVVSKAFAASRLFSFLELKKIYHKLVKANSKLRSTNNDPVLVLDLLVSDICLR